MKKTPKFKSKFEAKVWEEAVKLDPRIEYEPNEVRLAWRIEGNYIPDFVLGNSIIVETKGKLDYQSRRKMIAVKKANPKVDIRFVFMKANNKLMRTGKMTYAQWADRNGFPWAEGNIPEEWIKEV